jgi:putative transposase
MQVFGSAHAEIAAWTILPNHYHLLVGVMDFELIPTTLQMLHGGTSYAWNKEDGYTGRKVWYKYTDRYIRNEKHYYCALNYIHFNPVKHGYAKSPYEWRWSSLRLYEEDFGREWLQTMWQEYPPDGIKED